MAKRISLCPACDACPSVEVDEHEVRIGEADNLVKLTPAACAGRGPVRACAILESLEERAR